MMSAFTQAGEGREHANCVCVEWFSRGGMSGEEDISSCDDQKQE